VSFSRIDHPGQLPPPTEVRLLLVDWGARDQTWATAIRAWLDAEPDVARPRIVLFGPHTDLDAHAAAKAAGIGPMRARSALFAELPTLLAG
jgi:hypothetical protein